MSSPKPYNLDYEKQYISALIRSEGALLADTPHINERDFGDTHRPIFQMIKTCLATDGVVTKLVLIEKLKAVGIKIGGVIEPDIYINNIELIAVNERAAIEIAKQIKQKTIRRELDRTIDQMKRTLSASEEMTATELVAEITKQFNGKVNVLSGMDEKEPVDIYGTIDDFLNSDNFFSDRAVIPPFPLYADRWGYWDAGAVTTICSRMKIGKSSFWLSSALQLALADEDDNFRMLTLDTELTPAENQSRSLAQVSGVLEFRIRQGYYKKNREEKRKVMEAADTLRPLTKRLSHVFCGEMELDEIVSTARRWAKKTLTEGKKGIIVFDYLKLNSAADFRSKTSLSIQIGEKINCMKNMSKELRIPILCFAQTNRENVDSKAGEKQDNSSVIGGSDMIAQFSSQVLLLSELSVEEKVWLNQMGPGDATHSLKEIACRQRGEGKLTSNSLVKYKDDRGKDKFTRDWIALNFDSFNVREVGCLRSLVAKNEIRNVPVQSSPPAPVNPDDPTDQVQAAPLL